MRFSFKRPRGLGTGAVVLLAIGLVAEARAATFRCTGTEPFWGLTIGNQRPTFRDPDTGRVRRILPGKAQVPRGTTEQYAAIYRTQFRSENVPLVVALRADSCSDGMSDRTYPWSVHVILPSTTFIGCCTRHGK